MQCCNEAKFRGSGSNETIDGSGNSPRMNIPKKPTCPPRSRILTGRLIAASVRKTGAGGS